MATSGLADVWGERAARYAAPGTVQQASVEMRQVLRLMTLGERREGRELYQRVRAWARSDLTPSELASVLWVILAMPEPPSTTPERVAQARELAGLPEESIGARQMVFFYAGLILLDAGEREEAEQLWRRTQEAAQRMPMAANLLHDLTIQAVIAYLDGRVEESFALSEEIFRLAEAMGSPLAGSQMRAVVGRTPGMELGQPDAVADAVRHFAEASNTVGSALGTQLARSLSHGIVVIEQAHPQLVAALRDLPAPHEMNVMELCFLLKAAIRADDREIVKSLAEALVPGVDLAVGSYSFTSPARLLGEASILLGKPEEARKYYDQAFQISQNLRFRPEIALTRLALAELLLEHYPDEHDAAIEHLDFAIEELTEMKMQPALERALRHKGMLKA
jgi:tetratricopeptide (TPR) repeat protein